MTGIAVLVIFLQMMMICEPEPDMTGDLIILGMTVFVQIPLMIRYRKYVREALAAAAYYEKAGRRTQMACCGGVLTMTGQLFLN